MPEQYKRFGIKVSKIDGISLGACLSIDMYNEEGYLYINFFKWEICIGWMWFEKLPKKQVNPRERILYLKFLKLLLYYNWI